MRFPIIPIPPAYKTARIIAATSGGKDSTALILALRELGLPFDCVFADTKWEAPQVYEYLDMLETRLGIKIQRVVGKHGGMEATAIRKGMFPKRLARWCTEELKIIPIKGFHAKVQDAWDTDTINAVGIRRDESESRARALGFEYEREADWYTWRPLLDWSVDMVLAMHHRHGIPINPLYKMGFSRVGCMPCIMSKKEEIRLMAEHFPERVTRVDVLESALTARRRHLEKEDNKQSTFFQGSKGTQRADINSVVAWSKTKHGGKAPLIDTTPSGGCYRWGLCELPPPPVDARLSPGEPPPPEGM